MTARIYLSTTIPYVNARPHLGFALEVVQADVLARHHRQAGDAVRFQTGTDDNSLKNVLAAEAAGTGTGEFVAATGAAFARLGDQLRLSADDFIATSSDRRHRPGVERLWHDCAASGDLYRKHYSGQYCVGCEQFYAPAELPGGRCPEHETEPQLVTEENWFFRLSRYSGRLRELIGSGRLRIEPAARRNEVLAFIDGGLEDFSASRSTARARGWGIPVPGDPSQVIYVWWDALGNYVSALGYGSGGEAYPRWWEGSERRIHLAGKGVVRFHAVYWPAILLSAGLPLPTDILVHDYLTIGGRRISKSGSANGGPAPAQTTDPEELVARYGTDAVRWWLLREVPRTGDTDFTAERLIARANDELANGIGNLVSRVVTLVHRFREGVIPRRRAWATAGAGPVAGGTAGAGSALGWPAAAAPAGAAPEEGPLIAACERAQGLVAQALAEPDFRAATAAVLAVAEAANRLVQQARPWELARAARRGDQRASARLDALLELLVGSCLCLAGQLAPFAPDLASRIAAACDDSAGRLPEPVPVFPRLTGLAGPLAGYASAVSRG